MKRYKKGYIEKDGADIIAVITMITERTDENGLTDIDENELKRYSGFKNNAEAAAFLKDEKIKNIEVE